MKYNIFQEAGLPPPPGYLHQTRRRPIPWEGLFKLVISILAIIATGALVTEGAMSQNKILFINLYLFFIVSAIIDLLIFYNGYTIIPEGLQSFILSGCFTVEFLCFYTIIEDDTRHIFIFLLAISTVLSFTSLLETVVENRLIKFCRSYFTTLQGTWLLQLSR